MWILQWYIFRDLFKAMVLTTIGMTLVFTLGGGVANMIKGVSITSLELMELLGYFLPVATTLTLPVAGLLSTTNVYGRLSASNEFVACRASGINIHRLLLSAFIVAIAVGAFTFYFSNYVIPDFIMQIDAKARRSIEQLVYRELRMNKYMKYQDFAFHADGIKLIHGDPNNPKDYLRIQGAAFIELDSDDAVQFGTAPSALIEFDKTDQLPLVRAVMNNVTVFDRIRLRYQQLQSQAFGPMPISMPLRMKAKWLNLPDLLKYREHPEQLPEITDSVNGIMRIITARVCYDEVVRAIQDGRDWIVGDDKGRFILKPDCDYRRTKEEGYPEMRNVTVIEEAPEGRRVLRAERGAIRADRIFGASLPYVSISLHNLTIERPGEKPVERVKLELRAVPVPKAYADRAAQYANQIIEQPDMPLGLGVRIDNARIRVQKELGEQTRKITGIIHSRAAFSASCIVLIVLGAVLGIVFRGGQALVSFGLSCIPFAVVIVTIIMGRQLAQNEGTVEVGLVVLWSGIGVMLIVDFLMLFRWLRR